MMLEAPFDKAPRELMRTRGRMVDLPTHVNWAGTGRGADLAWTRSGFAWVEEFDFQNSSKSIWLLDARAAKPRAALLDSGPAADSAVRVGTPVLLASGRKETLIASQGEEIYLRAGRCSQRSCLAIKRLNARTLRQETLMQANESPGTELIAFVPGSSPAIATFEQVEGRRAALVATDSRTGISRVIAAVSDLPPEVAAVQVREVRYTRADGVPLGGTLYLPPNRTDGQRLPLVVWGYPISYTSADDVRLALTNTLSDPWAPRSAGHPSPQLMVRLLAARGFAILDNATMPIVGGVDRNDTQLEQLILNAEAAVRYVIDAGIADPRRIGIAGHSRGGTMVAQLVAHTHLFAAGVAVDGGYNYIECALDRGGPSIAVGGAGCLPQALVAPGGGQDRRRAPPDPWTRGHQLRHDARRCPPHVPGAGQPGEERPARDAAGRGPHADARARIGTARRLGNRRVVHAAFSGTGRRPEQNLKAIPSTLSTTVV